MLFLSADWVARLNQLLQESDLRLPASTATDLCIQNVITQGGSEPDICYYISVDKTGARAESGVSENPCVTFTQSWQTAQSLARHDYDAHRALLMGELKISGDVTFLLGQEQVVSEIQQITRSINQDTQFETA